MTYLPTAADVSPAPPVGDGTPPPTGDITVPQSPSGTSVDDVDRSESATETFLSGVGPNVPQQGTAAQTEAPVIAGCSSVPWNNTNPGNGTPGNKFS